MPKPREISEIFNEMGDWYIALERAVAGYLKLSQPLTPVPEGARKPGLPIFEMNASADGKTVKTVALDLSKLDPTYLGHVLVPLIEMLRGQIQEAVAEIQLRVQEVQDFFPQQANT